MAELNIDIVAVDSKIWSGQGTFLFTRTTSGEIGILPGHWDHLSVLVPGGLVDIRTGDGTEGRTLAAVHGGFLLVHDNVVRSGALTLADLGITPTAAEVILPTYLDRFRVGGRYNQQAPA